MTPFSEYRERPHFAALDGLRGISMLLVLVEHLPGAWWEWFTGRQGVTVFFVLSGFLITTLAIREEGRLGSLSITAFFVRRAFRIFPLYYATLGVYCALMFGNFGPPGRAEVFAAALPAYVLYAQELVRLIPGGVAFAHSWSLGIEEKFYLLWPTVAFGVLRGQPLPTRAIVTALALVANLVLTALVPIDVALVVFWYHSILAGAVLAFLFEHPRTYEATQFLGTPGFTVAVLLAWFAYHVFLASNPDVNLVLSTTAYTGFATALVAVTIRGANGWTRLLSHTSLTYCGRVSYSLYLLHILCILLVERVIPLAPGVGRDIAVSMSATLVAFGAATLTHHGFEKPLVEWGRRVAARVR